MTPPPMLYIDWPTKAGDDDPIPAWTDSDQLHSDVPYMLARPMPIADAPMDGTPVLVYSRVDGWALVSRYSYGGLWVALNGGYDSQSIHNPTHWLPLPPAPEEA